MVRDTITKLEKRLDSVEESLVIAASSLASSAVVQQNLYSEAVKKTFQ